MVALSEKTSGLIKDDIVSTLYNSPQAMFASEIAEEVRRDKEFVKRLLLDLKAAGIVEEITKGPDGKVYKERMRWRIKPDVVKAFEQKQG